MKHFNKMMTTLALTLTLAAFMVGFNACSSETPMQSNQISETESTPQFTMLKALHPRLNKVFEQSLWIGTAGGTITVGDSVCGTSKLIIPSGAIGSSSNAAATTNLGATAGDYNAFVNITFWWESNSFQAEFSPHGITFNVPVRMELSYKDADLTGVDENDLKIYYYNEEAGVWEIISSEVDTVNDIVIGYTNHFSRYALGGGE